MTKDTSFHQLPPTLLVPRLRDLEDHIGSVPGDRAHELSFARYAADLLHGAERAPVFHADPEDGGIDECEGGVEHQPLGFAVYGAAPVAAGKKRPADLDLAPLRLIAMVAARADQAAGRTVDDRKSLL